MWLYQLQLFHHISQIDLVCIEYVSIVADVRGSAGWHVSLVFVFEWLKNRR